MSTSPIRSRRLGLMFLSLVFGLEIIGILWLNHGVFTYTLDDPYIHLALAQNIHAGHYGINSQDYSSPASSILWPFLLSLFAPSQSFYLVPLIINIGCSLLMFLVITSCLQMQLPHISHTRATITATLLTLSFNAVGLALNGMEHDLHMLCSLLILLGLMQAERDASVPGWLYPALVVNPLIRPEGMALSVLSTMYLALRHRKPSALIAAVVIAALVTGYGFYLSSLGLDPIPSSVEVKSTSIHGGSEIGTRLQIIIGNLLNYEGIVVIIGTLLLLNTVLRRNHPLWPIAAIVALCGGAHLIFGRVGWFARYEDYINALLYLTAIIIYWPKLARYWNEKRWLNKPLFIFSAFLLSAPYFQCTLITPFAAHNIYQQHYQMHRLVQHYYPHAVAVNDIGYVSLNNPHYVLDLFGLAYHEAFVERTHASNPDWMDRLTNEKHVKLAMLHDRWFPKVPKSWTRLGELTFIGPQITPIDRTVSFYATDAKSVPAMMTMLHRFANSLPPSVAFKFTRTRIIRAE